MASLTVRNLPDEAKLRFRQVAAAHGRSMEEHLRQLIIDADFGGASGVVGHVAEKPDRFAHQPPAANETRKDLVTRLLEIADGAGGGVFDAGKYAEIRFMTAKDAMAELRRLANGITLPEPPRLSTATEAPDL